MKKSITIIGLGDSITAGNPEFLSPVENPPEGSGNPQSQYAYWLMQTHPDWRVLNRGIGGQRSDEILARFTPDVLSHRPDAVIILAGVNDLYQGLPPDWVIENLQQLYDRAQKAGLRVVTCSIMPYAGIRPAVLSRLQAVNDWIERASRQRGFGFCDLYRAMQDPQRPQELQHTADGLHPNVEGYRRMAAALSPVVEAVLE